MKDFKHFRNDSTKCLRVRPKSRYIKNLWSFTCRCGFLNWTWFHFSIILHKFVSVTIISHLCDHCFPPCSNLWKYHVNILWLSWKYALQFDLTPFSNYHAISLPLKGKLNLYPASLLHLTAKHFQVEAPLSPCCTISGVFSVLKELTFRSIWVDDHCYLWNSP